MKDKDIIENWVKDRKNDYVANYKRLKLKASGNWEKELEEKIEQKSNNWKITFLGANYTQQLVSGRRKNINQNNIRAFVGWAGSTFLADWVKNKGLNINPFAVAYKIAREGIKVPNRFNEGTLIDNVLTDKNIDDLLKQLLIYQSTELKSEIKKIWQ